MKLNETDKKKAFSTLLNGTLYFSLENVENILTTHVLETVKATWEKMKCNCFIRSIAEDKTPVCSFYPNGHTECFQETCPLLTEIK